MSASAPAGHLKAVYLSSQDVRDLGHYNYYISINHGCHQRYVDSRYPGWRWDQLYPVLRSKAALERRPGDTSPRHLPDGVVGVLVFIDGSIVVDDGSLAHPEKEASQARGDAR